MPDVKPHGCEELKLAIGYNFQFQCCRDCHCDDATMTVVTHGGRGYYLVCCSLTNVMRELSGVKHKADGGLTDAS